MAGSSLLADIVLNNMTDLELFEAVQYNLNDINKVDLAENTDNIHILEKLSRSKYWTVRFAVATNPHTTPGVLSELAADENEDIRIAVARNPHTLPEDLEELSEDPSEEVRKVFCDDPLFF